MRSNSVESLVYLDLDEDEKYDLLQTYQLRRRL